MENPIDATRGPSRAYVFSMTSNSGDSSSVRPHRGEPGPPRLPSVRGVPAADQLRVQRWLLPFEQE